MTPGPDWERALERAARSRVTLVLGASDTGKTSLATFLANSLARSGFRVGIVDADLGQSEIGPPATIGLGRVTARLERLAAAELVGLYFVGSTSPPGHVRSTVTGTRRMLDRATAEGLERVIVDTSGLIEGPLGRAIKRRKIDMIAPDLLICLQQAGECEPILESVKSGSRPEILRLPVGAPVRRRSAEERRRHRASVFNAYFNQPSTRCLDLSGLRLEGTGDRPSPAWLALPDGIGPAEAEGALVGLADAGGETLGLGMLRARDAGAFRLLVETPVSESGIVTIRVGRRPLRLSASTR